MKKKLKSQGASDKQESLFGPEWQSASTDVELLQLMKYDFDQVFLLEFLCELDFLALACLVNVCGILPRI